MIPFRRLPKLILVAFGSAATLAWAVSVCSVFAIMFSPCALISAVTTSIPLKHPKGKANLQIAAGDDGAAMICGGPRPEGSNGDDQAISVETPSAHRGHVSARV
jgi:hypothetical protein